jgi:mannose-6-phosphate isomerase
VKPVELAPNQLHRFYRGGEAIARFRGVPSTDDHAPEDWVGSTASLFGANGAGLSALPDGRLLRDAIAADPVAYLGPAHTAQYGTDSALLVKLLDAGERLPVHFHPDQAFARSRLGLAHGKTEAWLIVETRGDRPTVWLGFREDVDLDVLAGWVDRQDRTTMLDALNELTVGPGDCFFVPAGLPHAIGEGVFLLEVQEPSDLSVLLEWAGFDVDGRRDGHLGLGFAVALQNARRAALRGDELTELRRQTAAAPESRPGARTFLPAAASSFFRAERLHPAPAVSLEQEFSILVALDGEGRLDTEGGTATLSRGDSLLVPHAAGPGELTGSVDVIRCLPPAPSGDRKRDLQD